LLLSLGLVTALVYHLAQPIPGVGIALPPILPSVATAVIALAVDRRAAPSTAFIAGTLGTLVGADLLNLGASGTWGPRGFHRRGRDLRRVSRLGSWRCSWRGCRAPAGRHLE